MRSYVRNDRRLRLIDNRLVIRKDTKQTIVYIPLDLYYRALQSSGKHKTCFNSEVLRLMKIALDIESRGETA